MNSSMSQNVLRQRIVLSLELVLWIVASLSLGFVLWSQLDSYLYQREYRGMVSSPDASQQAMTAPRVAVVPVGFPIATLEIPRLGLSVVVAEGSTSAVLRRAVGHIESSSRLGEPGNVVLAGHRDTFFRPLENVREGDLIILEHHAGRQHYEVEWTKIVEPAETSVMAPAPAALTLVTCYPFRYVGNAPERFVVRATALGEP